MWDYVNNIYLHHDMTSHKGSFQFYAFFMSPVEYFVYESGATIFIENYCKIFHAIVT